MTADPNIGASEEPLGIPEEEGATFQEVRQHPGEWAKENLFSNWWNSLLTIVFGALLAWVLFRAARFVFVTGRWDVVQVNLTNFLVGRFPRGELYRVWTAIYLGITAVSLGSGLGAHLRPPLPLTRRLRFAAPVLVALSVMLSFSRTILPGLLVVGGFLLAVTAYQVGRRLPKRLHRRVVLLYIATVFAAYAALTAFGGVGFDRWGGLLLTVFVAMAGIVLSFPFGVLLALGRRSTFPAVRMVCVAWIEMIRGVPLVTILFIGAVVLGFFLPPAMDRPSLTMRALIGIIMFASAYIAEIVRGGLQSVPKGQTEAAKAIGLSPIKTIYRIVLPQALRNVIPAIVGQFISLYKDTSLLAILGLLEILGVAQSIVLQPAFLGQGLQAEALVFASFLFWIACFTMSRASQRLEQRLGLGER
jgi:general L-amino acid transport system permease protein